MIGSRNDGRRGDPGLDDQWWSLEIRIAPNPSGEVPARGERAGTTTVAKHASLHLELVGADVDLLCAVAVAVDDAGVVVEIEVGH